MEYSCWRIRSFADANGVHGESANPNKAISTNKGVSCYYFLSICKIFLNIVLELQNYSILEVTRRDHSD